jgi:hypothetical protein
MPGPVDAEFLKVLTAAINDFAKHGYDNPDRVDEWMEKLREVLERAMMDPEELEEKITESLKAIFQRQVEDEGILRRHPGVEKFTLENIKPELREELERRIKASAALIKLNRDEAIEKTLRRFAGWSTSVPAGGTAEPKKRDTKMEIKRGIAGLGFIERRVIIDQGHKLTSAINAIVAEGADAIAGEWHSHWRQPNYDYREDHKERDEVVYLMRNSWAQQEGLVKAGPAGYVDDITQPGEEINCRCFYEYIYNLRDLPESMLTAKGKRALAEVSQEA